MASRRFTCPSNAEVHPGLPVAPKHCHTSAQVQAEKVTKATAKEDAEHDKATSIANIAQPSDVLTIPHAKRPVALSIEDGLHEPMLDTVGRESLEPVEGEERVSDGNGDMDIDIDKPGPTELMGIIPNWATAAPKEPIFQSSQEIHTTTVQLNPALGDAPAFSFGGIPSGDEEDKVERAAAKKIEVIQLPPSTSKILQAYQKKAREHPNHTDLPHETLENFKKLVIPIACDMDPHFCALQHIQLTKKPKPQPDQTQTDQQGLELTTPMQSKRPKRSRMELQLLDAAEAAHKKADHAMTQATEGADEPGLALDTKHSRSR
ncbi:hypothetical protein H0H81_002979, partial [Sphagnurus paluster]